MAEKGQSSQTRGQGASAAGEVDPQMPMGLEQMVKDMMQQMELFKRDPRVKHLFVQGETSETAYDVPRPTVQVDVQP